MIVEDAADAAAPVIRRVMAEHPTVAARLIVAGRAVAGGQKVHNLRAATADLAAEIRALVFVDSDARPRPEWLRLAMARLAEPGVAAATGYRWFVPKRPPWPIASFTASTRRSCRSSVATIVAWFGAAPG